jgi:uncharacterized membrane protein YedE/YeeE
MKKLWNPYLGGFGLGLVLLLSYLLVGHGLGASGAADILGAEAVKVVAPAYATQGSSFAHYFADGQNPMNSWLIFMAIGIFMGGLISSVLHGRNKLEIIRGAHTTDKRRMILALVGGIIMGVGARIGRGCTSSQALSGGALLSVGSWIFMLAIFAGAYSVAYFIRREWL